MRAPLLIVLSISCWLSTAAPLAAAVYVVDAAGGAGSHFTSLPAAVAAAQDGDTLLVRKGVYSATLVQAKGLHIVRDGAGPVTVHGMSVRTLAASQSVLLRGLLIVGFTDIGLGVKNNAGPVLVEDCEVRGSGGINTFSSPDYHPDGYVGAEVIGSPAVTFVRCLVRGGSGPDITSEQTQTIPGSGAEGLFVSLSRVAFYDSLALGGSGGNDDEDHQSGGGGGDGARVIAQSFLFGSNSEFRGGNGGFGGFESFSGCGNGGSGGDGLWNEAGTEVRHLDCYFRGGRGGSSGGFGCSNGADGTPGGPPAGKIEGKARTLELASPVREGNATTLEITGVAGDLFFVMLSQAHGFEFIESARGVLAPYAAPPFMIPVSPIPLVLPAGGSQVLSHAVPLLPASVAASHWTMQALVVNAHGLPVLSSASVLTVVDASF